MFCREPAILGTDERCRVPTRNYVLHVFFTKLGWNRLGSQQIHSIEITVYFGEDTFFNIPFQIDDRNSAQDVAETYYETTFSSVSEVT